jgi:hypothetical protein
MHKKRIIKKDIKYHNIGGEEFVIEEEWDIDDVVFKGLFTGNWACRNFLDRRDISELGNNKPKVYYGKVGCLGYIIAEDEFESIEEQESNEDGF